MSGTDEKIVKALENLQADVTALRTGQQALEAGQRALETGQKLIQADVKGLHGKVDTLELKVEAVHAYQKQAHTEITDALFQSNEITGKAQRTLEEQVEQIKEHVGLPPLK
jgi:predicted nuclease with TOPRIM domain